ncbi:Protein strawberry notch-like 1 [Hondaea fermentalgiana]|uniref:Protein strawberry notch-like 1 n=1 Tax=Hondaea fermentalgiana TaxID=2315210 RepID=A0A2R5GG78_9STRA|nr:Protein strawberry notch-like 1 [Hondaea fermentalgiana]|eukprot:GBG27653.1 Protein strawberry notch-like 1 [Hondaea fermentalgiana]
MSTDPEGEHGAAWDAYVCRSGVRAGRPHPGHIVEPASLAAVTLPPLTYPVLDALGEQVERGDLSQLQLEGVAYACQKHQHIMPDRTRSGFFIGDATGTGKGRQIAGIVVDNMSRGRRRHLWCSTSVDLIKDAMRDFQDLHVNVTVHNGVRMLDKSNKGLGASKASRKGVLFTTYASLVSSTATRDRFDQIASWLGDDEEFEGCLIFDECHKAKNFAEKEGKGSRVAKAVVRLQRRFPRARCVYVSATGVSDISNMAYMDRLGLWGKGAAFESFDDFRTSMGRRNMGALEMLAIELKSTGYHVSRGLSFADTTFDLVQATLTAEQLRIYFGATALWNDLQIALEQAIELAGASGKLWSPFWSAHQRFFKQLCVAFKVPDVVRLARGALADGHCVVIGLQSTGEAAVDFWSTGCTPAQRDKLSACAVGNLAILNFLQSHFPTVHADVASMQARTQQGSSQDALTSANTALMNLHAETHAKLEAMKASFIARATALELPASAIDDLIHQLGGHRSVAEMTGRRNCILADESVSSEAPLSAHATRCTVVQRQDIVARSKLAGPLTDATAKGKLATTAAAPPSAAGSTASSNAIEMESLNIGEKEAFMAGSKLLAIISDAASTGISLHADQRVANKRRRIHITCELAWAADTAVQQLGRSHRSSQVCAPMFKLVTSGIGGENRFISAVASRLRSLGALTHGDRRASTAGVALDDFDFDSIHGRKALQELCVHTSRSAVVPGVAWSQVLQRVRDLWSRAENAGATFGTTVNAVDITKDAQEEVAVVAGQSPKHWPKSEASFVLCAAKCLRLIFTNVRATQVFSCTALNLNVSEADRKSVKKFLNKLLGLPIHLQAFLFEYFTATLDSIVEQAKLDGTFDEGVSDVHANSVSAAQAPEVVYTDPATGGELKLHVLRLDRGVSFESAMGWLKRGIEIARAKVEARKGRAAPQEFEKSTLSSASEDSSSASARESESARPKDNTSFVEEASVLGAGGFYVSRNHSVAGQDFMYALAVKLDARSEKYSIFRPNTGRAALEKTKRELDRTYKPIGLEQARSIWENVFAMTKDGCIHGPGCPEGRKCSFGVRIQHVGLLTGAVVPLWTQLAEVLADPTLGIPRFDQRMRVVRAQLDSGERAIGIKWHINALSALRHKLAQLNARLHSVRLVIPNGARQYGFALFPDLRIKVLSDEARVAGLRPDQMLVQVGDARLGPGATRDQAMALIREKFNRVSRVLDLVVRDVDSTPLANKGQTGGAPASVFEEPTQIVPASCKALARKPMTLLGFFAKQKKKRNDDDDSTSASTQVIDLQRASKRSRPSVAPSSPIVIELD